MSRDCLSEPSEIRFFIQRAIPEKADMISYKLCG